MRRRSMVTATRSKTKQTITVPRFWLCQVQVRNLLCRTTDISQDSLEKIAGMGLRNQWLQTIGVYGIDTENRTHVGLQIRIDWATHTVYVLVEGLEVTIERTVYPDNLAPEVGNAITVFNQAVIEECLQTEWRVSYCKGVDLEHVRRELGTAPAAPMQWAGKVEQQAFTIKEVPELTVVFRQAVPKTDEGKEQGLFDQIKEALHGE
jgi:hypothetical protein